MEKEEMRVLTLDKYEHGIIIHALNDMRNDLLDEERPTDAVDDVLLKTIDAPARKVRFGGVPEKSGDFLGEGGATEHGSFRSEGTKRTERSLRRRDDEAR